MFARILIVIAVALVLWLAFARGSNSAGPVQHVTVRAGDTLWTLASAHYSGDPREGVYKIQQLNHLSSCDMLAPGQRLVLP
jgi:nucleoid-associated protein YgaU